MKLGRRNGRLLRRNGKLCRGCCGGSGPCCGYPGYTDCNGVEVPGGQYGTRIRYNFQTTATVTATTSVRTWTSPCTSNAGTICSGNYSLDYTHSGFIEFTYTNNQCLRGARQQTGSIEVRNAGELHGSIDLSDPLYNGLLLGPQPRSDLPPLHAQFPDFEQQDLSGLVFGEPLYYTGFGTSIPQPIGGPTIYQAASNGTRQTSIDLADCNANATDFVRAFAPVNAPATEFLFWMSVSIQPNGTADAPGCGITATTPDDPGCDGLVPACVRTRGVAGGGPNSIRTFGSGPCSGLVWITNINNGSLQSSGVIDPTGSTYSSDVLIERSSDSFDCCNTLGTTAQRTRSRYTLAMNIDQSNSIEILEPC